MDIQWDPEKSAFCQRHPKRKCSFEQASQIFSGNYVEWQKSDNPEQYLAVGFVEGRLISVVFEYRDIETQPYIWLITLWKTTTHERKRFEQLYRP